MQREASTLSIWPPSPKAPQRERSESLNNPLLGSITDLSLAARSTDTSPLGNQNVPALRIAMSQQTRTPKPNDAVGRTRRRVKIEIATTGVTAALTKAAASGSLIDTVMTKIQTKSGTETGSRKKVAAREKIEKGAVIDGNPAEVKAWRSELTSFACKSHKHQLQRLPTTTRCTGWKLLHLLEQTPRQWMAVRPTPRWTLTTMRKWARYL